MHILERLYLASLMFLYDDLEITAPKVLDKTWKTTRIFRRYPERHYEITEGECVEEDLVPGKDSSATTYSSESAKPGRVSSHGEMIWLSEMG